MIGLSRARREAPKSNLPQEDDLRSVVGLLVGSKGSNTLEPSLLCDVAEMVTAFASSDRAREAQRIRIGEAPWELGLEWFGSDLGVSLFSGGSIPIVLVHDQRTDARSLKERLHAALSIAEGTTARVCDRVAAALTRIDHMPTVTEHESELEPLIVETPTELSFGLSAELAVRPKESTPGPSSVLRADLFGLLCRGKIRVSAFDTTKEIADVHVFLVAEQLAKLTLEALEAHSSLRPMWRKVQIGGAVTGIRLVPQASEPDAPGAVGITLGPLPRAPSEYRESWTFPSVDLSSFAEGVVAFGRALARSLVRRDRSYSHNLRLVELRAKLREIADAIRVENRPPSIVNESPESYRAYAAAATKAAVSDVSRARLRYSAVWQAAVPSIDLRATFLTSEGLVVGSSREMCCILRSSGHILWRKPVTRAATVLTPCGLARFDGEGTLKLHDVSTGEARWSLRLAPRVGAPVTGAVVSAPALPRMLILTEGARHVTGVDLESGEVKWRFAARRGGTFRLRRAGKLVAVTSGDQSLTALDVVTGEVVWRSCDRLRFVSPVTVEKDALYAISGDGAYVGRGGTRLSHFDPWSGERRWSVELPARAKPVGSPLSCTDTVVVTTHGGRGTAVIGFDAQTGEQLFEREGCLGAAAAVAIDDTVLLNSDAGEFVAVDGRTGNVRYRHVFADSAEGDRPRRLDPVLRSGALFVPQSSVHVVRPGDGALLGAVETDLVPDLIRVDERCNVIVAEESGHVAAFAVGPKLSLVK